MGKRYINEISLNMDPVYVENSMQAYLKQNDFKFVNEKGDSFYKTSGVMRCFKYWYYNGVLHVEAWIGKVGKEMDISDKKIVGAAYKIPFYNSVLSLLGAFEKDRQMYQNLSAQSLGAQNFEAQNPGAQNFDAQNPGAQNFGTQNPGAQNFGTQNPGVPNFEAQNPGVPNFGTQNYGTQNPGAQNFGAQGYEQGNTQPYGAYNQTNSAVLQEINVANDRNAVIAFWLSIAALILVFGSKLSLLASVGSYYLAIAYGLKSKKRGMATAAIIINSIAIVIAILIFIGAIFG